MQAETPLVFLRNLELFAFDAAVPGLSPDMDQRAALQCLNTHLEVIDAGSVLLVCDDLTAESVEAVVDAVPALFQRARVLATGHVNSVLGALASPTAGGLPAAVFEIGMLTTAESRDVIKGALSGGLTGKKKAERVLEVDAFMIEVEKELDTFLSVDIGNLPITVSTVARALRGFSGEGLKSELKDIMTAVRAHSRSLSLRSFTRSDSEKVRRASATPVATDVKAVIQVCCRW